MKTDDEKWEAYEEAVKSNIANHKEEDIQKDEAFLKFLDTVIKAHTEEVGDE